MILRRPYAFFIKHFRFVHFVLMVLTAYLSYNTIKLVTFFNEYMKTTAALVDKDVTRQLFPPVMFIAVFSSILLATAILLLMSWKNKPVLFYIINIASNVYMWGIYVYSKVIVTTLETSFADLKTLKLIHDLLVIGLVFQGITFIITAIRSTGFDFKKFDFESDLDLKIDALDDEEFEFDVDVDTDKFKRSVKKFIRHLKYVYKENKLPIILGGFLTLALISSAVYVNLGVYSKIYKVGDTFRTSYFGFGVVEAYSTSKDYHGENLTNNKLVILKVRAKNMSKIDMGLEVGKIALTDKYKSFYHTTKYQKKFIDIGYDYVNKEISKENFEEYLLVYEIPKELINDKLYVKYHDTKDKTITVSIKPKSLDEEKEKKKYTITDKIDFDGSLAGSSKLTIDSYEIANRFKQEYRFCINANDCYSSYEYIVPTVKDNYSKTILKLNGSFKFDEKQNVQKLEANEFLENYASLVYKIDGVEKTMTDLKAVTPKKIISKSNYYLEVYDEVKQAENIALKIVIRDHTYYYRLK